ATWKMPHTPPSTSQIAERLCGLARIRLMNTSAIGAIIKQRVSTLRTAFRQLPRELFGNVSYRPPLWLSWTAEKSQQAEVAHSRVVVSTIIGLFLLSCAGGWTWNWYQHLPRPKRVTAKVQ